MGIKKERKLSNTACQLPRRKRCCQLLSDLEPSRVPRGIGGSSAGHGVRESRGWVAGETGRYSITHVRPRFRWAAAYCRYECILETAKRVECMGVMTESGRVVLCRLPLSVAPPARSEEVGKVFADMYRSSEHVGMRLNSKEFVLSPEGAEDRVPRQMQMSCADE